MAKPDYSAGVAYWARVEATDDGVLGGFGNGSLPRIDALSTRTFILTALPRLSTIPGPHKADNGSQDSGKENRQERKRLTKALDLGAGIGRVSASVLIPLLDRVDLVDPLKHFLERANELAPSWPRIAKSEAGIRTFAVGMQFFNPLDPDPTYLVQKPIRGPKDEYNNNGDDDTGEQDFAQGDYDLIIMQWCTGHLSDAEFIGLLQRCKKSLVEPDGVIIIKDNLARPNTPTDVFDYDDSSLIRAEANMKRIFESAGLKIIREKLQDNFPEDLYPVKMFALR